MKVAHGNKVLDEKQLRKFAEDVGPEWLGDFLVGLSEEVDSDVVVGLELNHKGKVVTNESIRRLKPWADGYHYGEALIRWSNILRCPSAEAALDRMLDEIDKIK
ncbi:MAG: hypothetical protein WBO92_00020 [Candidatus Moraniibacteriota bacterium]